MTIKELITWGHQELIQFDSARLDAELLLSHVLKKPPTYVLAHDERSISCWEEWSYKRMITKRKKGVPVAYLRGHREFYGLDFEINKHVLVPRPDTEALVEAVIRYLSPDDLLLDVGTGSGCIPISVLKHVKGVEAIATDISSSALRVAKRNAERHGVGDRLQFFNSNLLSSIDPTLLEGRGLVVTANLPYVPTDYQVNIETRFEPQIALYGGDDGLDLYQRLIDELMPFEPRALFFECFDFQRAILAERLPDYRLMNATLILGGADVMMLERHPSSSS